MYARIIGAAAVAAAVCGPAFGQEPSAQPPPSAPQPWTDRVEAGADYRGDFTADDPRVPVGDRQVAAKCTVLPSSEKDGFDVSIRQTPDNKVINLVTLSLVLEIGLGTCTDFKVLRASAYDPSAILALGDNGRVRFYAGGGDYVVRVLTLARQPEKDPFLLRVRKLDPGVRARTFEPGGVILAATGSAAAPVSGDAVEQARTAYLQMCGKGQEKLSAATCAGMRRDLDAAAAAQAAAAREAEVMGVYRQLCAPAARKLSEDTCASMLAEAKRALAADPPPPPAAAAPATAKRPAARGAAARPEVKTAYQELCAAGAEQVSAETCAVLKADAAR